MKKEISWNEKKFIAGVHEVFAKNGDKKVAEGASAYMRNQFDYFGIPSPKRRLLMREIFSTDVLPPKEKLSPLVRKLWNAPQREMQYFAMELYLRYKKEFSPNDLSDFEYMITNRSWWDTVDFVAPKLCAELFRRFPEMIRAVTDRWISSGNTWLMRSAILFQLGYKKNTDFELLRSIIIRTAHEKEFFIRKAIGWALRQYSYTDAKAVKKMVKEIPLSPLSEREALKAILRANR